MKITDFDFENYRSFGLRRGPSLLLEFDLMKPDGTGPVDVAVIVGHDGSGKTSVLQALSSFFGILDSRLRAESFDVKDIRVETRQATVRANWLDGRTKFVGTCDIDRLKDGGALISWRGSTREAWSRALLDNRSGLIILFDSHRLLPPQGMREPHIEYEGIAAHAGALEPTWSWVRNCNDIRSIRFRSLKAWLVKLGLACSNNPKGPDAITFGLVKAALDSIFEVVRDTETVRFDRIDADHKVWFDSPNGRVTFEALSDGYRSLFVLVVELIYRLSLVAKVIAGFDLAKTLELEAVVLVDDIESHLHVSCHERLIPKLRKIFPNVQWIVTTHSPWIVGSVNPEEVFLLEEKETSDS